MSLYYYPTDNTKKSDARMTPKLPKYVQHTIPATISLVRKIDTSEIPYDLAEIVAAWPKLPNEIISVIMTIIRASIAQ